MARLHEYQGKALLKESGIPVPEGRVASSPQEVWKIAEEFGTEVVLKAQTWTTGRFSQGLIQFAANPEEAEEKAGELFGREVNDYQRR
ncbi:MAG: acetate--CoA ligase family protein [Calditrichia bacterium]